MAPVMCCSLVESAAYYCVATTGNGGLTSMCFSGWMRRLKDVAKHLSMKGSTADCLRNCAL